MKSIQIGDRVRWECVAGVIRGEIVDIRLVLNTNEELVPWLTIEYGSNRVEICGTDLNLSLMRFTVLFRDTEKQLETI